jgi:hypothetical protein
VLKQAGAKAKLEGVTITGHIELAAAPDAPATSLMLAPYATYVSNSQLCAKGAAQVMLVTTALHRLFACILQAAIF